MFNCCERLKRLEFGELAPRCIRKVKHKIAKYTGAWDLHANVSLTVAAIDSG